MFSSTVATLVLIFCIISSSALDTTGQRQSSSSILFSGVKLHPPLSTILSNMGITKPTPIQSSAIAPITAGVSCILHAETGSGKTLAYLLPMLKRMLTQETINPTPFQALIIVPTKELAVQVAADINVFTSEIQNKLSFPLINLCISTPRRSVKDYSSPIVVGTPFKILDIIQDASFSEHINSLKYIVVDEIDSLLGVPGRYASNQQLRLSREEENPTEDILNRIIKSRGGIEATNIQFIAASATIGRPLRRHLGKLLYAANTYTDMTVIRPPADTTVIRPPADTTVIRPPRITPTEPTRSVGIPSTIRHVIVMSDGESDELSTKLSAAKEVWVNCGGKRGILFVPNSEDVKQAIGVLNFWGLKNVRNLQRSLGISGDKPERGDIESGRRKIASSDVLINNARDCRVGASSMALDSHHSDNNNDDDGSELFVMPVSGSRGIHVRSVDWVFVVRPPFAMDGYLHMAGRTGRGGEGGTVVTIANLEEMKKMMSWQVPLGITFEVTYKNEVM